MIGMVTDLELVLDKLRDAAARPDVTAKAKGFRSFAQQGYQLRALVRAQQGFRAGRWVVTQRLAAMQRGTLQPLADGALGDAQGWGDLLLCRPLLGAFPGTEAAAFLPTSRRVAFGCAHSPGVYSTFRPMIIRSQCSDQ